MTKEDFLECAGIKRLEEKEWKKIHTVYLYHPSISKSHGREEIVALYKIGGMTIIDDMLDRAEIAKELLTTSVNATIIKNKLLRLQHV